MKKEVIFNKEAFALLLDKAKGDRSINQYANDIGVSAAHISRFLRQMINTPPSPETISKLASKAFNEVTYKDLMIAAGHISEDSTEDTYSPRNRRNRGEEAEKKFFQVILSELYTMPFKWSLKKPEDGLDFPDMIIDIDHEGYTKWYIEFRANFSNEKNVVTMNVFYIYGRIALTKLSPSDKFTIVVNSKAEFERFLKRPPTSLRANVYVMLIDIEKGKIVKEEMLCKYI
ncbi:MAG: hypothetical protein ABRQ25_12725 [Clostridiaceae bacterium]